MSLILRPYQEEALRAHLAAIDRGIRRQLIVMPTGTGKTALFAAIIQRHIEMDPGVTALVMAHRLELLEQSKARIASTNPETWVEIHRGDAPAASFSQVVVASVQGLGRDGSTSLEWLGPRLVVCDEAHHAAADTYQRVFERMGCYGGDALLLGVTATPHRMDNKALHGSDTAIFEEIIYQYALTRAIRDGYLVDLKGYRAASDVDLSGVKVRGGDYVSSQLEEKVNTSERNELAFKSWTEAAQGRHTIVFCAGVDHAKDVAAVFQAHGVSAASVDGAMPKKQRTDIMKRFASGEIRVLTNMDIATEGFDVPSCSCVLMLRPTKSWALYAQMVGRGLRVMPGVVDGVDEAEARRAAVLRSTKPNCVVIDIVDNTGRHSITKAPEHGQIPCLNGLVGLPDDFNPEGHTLGEAAEKFETLPEEAQAAAFRRPTSFSGLSAKLTAIDLIGELAEPEEAIEAGATLIWQRLKPGHYLLSAGFAEFAEEKSRTAHLVGDALGRWKLHLQSSTRDDVIELPMCDTLPIETAEEIVRSVFLGVDRFAGRSQGWQKHAPTEAQLRALRQWHVDPEVIARVTTRAMASKLLSRVIAESKITAGVGSK